MKPPINIFLVAIIMLPIMFFSDALSAAYPDRPITMINWTTAGMSDTVTRLLSRIAEKDLGRPILVENKPGAGGIIGLNYVVHSKPDGYTIGMGVTSNFIIKPHTSKLSYDIRTSTTDILTVCKYNNGLAVRADAPWNTYEDVLAYARKNPGKFRYSVAGRGGSSHITMERIAMKENIKWTAIPFKAGGEAVIALLGGHVDATIQGSIDELPHIKAGKIKLLLTLDGDKWPDVPTAPTIFEKGYDFSSLSYISYFGPKGIPEPIRQRLEDAFKNAMDDPSFDSIMKKFNVKKAFMKGKDYETLWKRNYDAQGKVIEALGLKEE